MYEALAAKMRERPSFAAAEEVIKTDQRHELCR